MSQTNQPETTQPPAADLGALVPRDLLVDPAQADAVAGLMVRQVALASNRVQPGALYCALPGTRTHGARYAQDALARGAVAILTDPDGAELLVGASDEPVQVPVLVSEHPRWTMARIAAGLNDHPSNHALMLAVTGTNGKTTTAYLVDAALAHLGLRSATIGTLGFRLAGEPVALDTSTITTPEAPDLQRLFATMVAGGAEAITMEVSSHALALGRVEATRFAVSGFTNLGRDHLDFHADMEDYFAAKASLFTPAMTGAAAICLDTEWGQHLVDRIGATMPVVTVGHETGVDLQVATTSPHPSGQVVGVRGLGQDFEFVLGLPGRHNASNAVLALAMVHLAGLDWVQAAQGLATAVVPGRMQPVDLGQDEQAPQVFVDFAHTPQAIDEVLGGLRRAVGTRLVTVVGAGGDRDRAKRPLMGRAAAAHSDLVVVTDDNPRTEDPAQIRQQVADGAREQADQAGPLDPGHGVEVLDVGGRRRAIAEALDRAAPGDLVMVLGKGHEQGQLVGTRVEPFDDVQCVREVWAERRAGERA